MPRQNQIRPSQCGIRAKRARQDMIDRETTNGY